MKHFKLISITSLVTALVVSLIYAVLFSPLVFTPKDIYHEQGTTSTGNFIRIDKHYSVSTTNAKMSGLDYNANRKGSKLDIVKNVNQFNFDNDYIIIRAVKNNFYSTINKKYRYYIVKKSNQQVSSFETEKEFDARCKELKIYPKLKSKDKFDWYNAAN